MALTYQQHLQLAALDAAKGALDSLAYAADTATRAREASDDWNEDEYMDHLLAIRSRLTTALHDNHPALPTE